MIAIDNVLLSDEVVKEQFVCDLSRCKGGCCEDGDAGAPVTDEERRLMETHFLVIAPLLTPAGKAAVDSQGLYTHDDEFGYVTPLVNNGICAYGYRDANGIITCTWEQTYNEGLQPFKKPVSCHLFPLKVSTPAAGSDLIYVNYEPRESEQLCAPACRLGKQLKMPVYRFARASLIRRFGTSFYEALEATATQVFGIK